jgi:DNA primase
MAIPQQTIDQILDRTDLVDLISQRVKLKKRDVHTLAVAHFIRKKARLFTSIETNSIITALVVKPMGMPLNS